MRRRTFIATGAAAVAAAKPASAFLFRSGPGGSPPPVTQSIVAVSPSSGVVTSGSGTNTVIAAVSVLLSPASPAFTGTLALTGADAASFNLSSSTLPSNLRTTGSLADGVYNLNIVATQAGLTGSPFTQPVVITVGAAVIGLVRTFTNVATGALPATAFWTIGHPFAEGEVPTGNIVTGALGATPVPLHAIARKLHADGSLAWAQLLVDMSGISLASGASAGLVLSASAGSWSSTTSRSQSDWTALVDTIEITNLSTSGTSAPDMDGAGTWVAAFDGGASNAIEVYGQGPLGLWVRVTANFVNGATTHRFLQAVQDYWVCEKADTSLGPIMSGQLRILNVAAFKTDPSKFTYDMSWKRNGAVQRTQTGVPQCFFSMAPMPRADGLWDWTANDPQVVVTQDYTMTRKTKKLPPFLDGISYVGSVGVNPDVSITGINTSTGAFTVANIGSVMTTFALPTAVTFVASTMPTGLTLGRVYYTAKIDGAHFNIYDNVTNALAAGSTGKIIPSTSGSAVVLHLAVGPYSGALITIGMGAPGPRSDISLLTEWGTAYHVGGTEGYQRLGRVTAMAASVIPVHVLNETTGKIPSLIDSGHTPAGMGTAKTSSYWFVEGGAYSSDIGGGSGPTGGLNSWGVEQSHFPSPTYAVWVMEGGTFMRDIILSRGNSTVGQDFSLVRRNQGVNGGTVRYGKNAVYFGPESRTGAWCMRDLVNACFVAGEGSDEETYFRQILKNNVDWVTDYLAWMPAHFQDIGSIQYAQEDFPPEAHVLGWNICSGFMLGYVSMVGAWAAYLQGDQIVGLQAMAEYFGKYIAAWYNSGDYSYWATMYEVGTSISDNQASNPGTFATSVQQIGLNAGGGGTFIVTYANGSPTIAWTAQGTPVLFAADDKFRPLNWSMQNGDSQTPAPSPFSDGTDYFIKSPNNIDSTHGTFELAATSGGTSLVPTASRDGGGLFLPSGQGGYPTGTFGGGLTNDPEAYLYYHICAMALHTLIGTTGASTALTAAQARATGGTSIFSILAAWAMQGTV